MRRILALVALAGAAACGDEGCPEPVYQGGATDEAWRSIVDAEGRALVGDPNAPVVTVPTEGQVLDASGAPPLFAWTSTLAAASAPRPPRIAAAPRRPFWTRWLELFEGTAYAHLPPVTGDIYYLQLEIPGRSCPYRVLTTELEWQPDADGWAAMKSAGTEPIVMRILSAYLTENRVSEGPYQPAAPRTFVVR